MVPLKIRLLCGYLCVALTLPNPALCVSAALPPATSADAAPAGAAPTFDVDLERALDAIEAQARALPRDTFEPQAVVETVGREVEALFTFVRDRTWWVPYEGCLRDAQGVLMDRVGNSLDRALCLVTILRAAGHEARLARGALTEAQARELVAKLPRLPDARVPARAAAAGEPLPAELESQRQKLAADVAARVAEQTATLRGLFGEHRAAAGASEDWRALSDHWWVQVKVPDDKWPDLDPLLPAAKPGEPLVAAQATIAYDADAAFAIPRESRHRLEIVVRVESVVGGKREERVALRHELVPAEVQGQPIALWFHPMDWPADTALVRDPEPMRRFRDACLAQKEWLPTLRIGERIVTQSSFTQSGSLNEKPVLDATQRLGKGVSGSLDRAVDVLGSRDGEAKTPAGELSAVFIDYALQAPGRAPEVHRRAVFDLLGVKRTDAAIMRTFVADAAQKLTRGLALRTKTNILPMCCQPSAEFVLTTAAAQTHQNRAAIRTASAAAASGDTLDFARALERLRPVPGLLPVLALARTALSRVGRDVYVDRLQLLCEEAGFAATADGAAVARVGFDIVANHFAVRAGQDAFAIAFEQGVADTAIEALVRDRMAPSENTGELLAVSRAQDVQWQRVDQRAGLDGLAVDDDVKAALAAELAAGFVVIVPQHPLELAGKQLYGWWRVDPTTGQTLGVMSTQRGQGMAEYAVVLCAGVLAFFGCAGATPGKNSNAKNAACLACAGLAAFAAATLLGVIGGGALGAFLGGRGGIPVGGVCNAISAAAS